MAEQIPYGVAVSLINRLASSAFREFGRIYGVMDELQNLKTTLESIKVVLSDAEQRQYQDPTIEHWITRFKEVLHDADNLLDDLYIKELQRKVDGDGKGVSKVRDFFSSENPLVFRGKLARKIEKIGKTFANVAKDMSNLQLISLAAPKQNEDEDEDAWREIGYVLQSNIIGREENKNEIIDLLKQTHTDDVSLIAIVGMGGLGKTALARLVYDDAEVQKLFQKKMWVCVSEDFGVKSVLNKMLKSLKGDEVGDLSIEILQRELRQELQGQSYMLVLDDVWDEREPKPLKLKDLRENLMCGGPGSKILVTSRSRMAAQIMDKNTLYDLNCLTKEQSLTLLKNSTFGKDDSRMSSNLESLEGIAEKCGGVPLAIITMGGYLRNREENSDQWSTILNDDIWELCKEKRSIMPVLKLGYQNLPLELRQCFAYCSLYPKDWQIEKDELIQLWMAQGYLESPNERQSMEDVGNQYVKILLMRSFFQEASLSEYNDITSFKMHDLMHDLAKSVAGNDCYLNCEEKGIVGRHTHVSFVSSTISLDSLDASKLRTVLWPKTEVGFVAEPSILKKLKYLRVLDLSSSFITSLPKSIDKLKHLRYLDLSDCEDLINLPKSIGNLVSLQTLKLRWCRKLEFSIEVITKLINLRHLDIEDCKAFEDMMPAGLGKLTSLQYLSNFAVGDNKKSKSAKLTELKDLNNIRGGLTITYLGLVKDVAKESQEANLKAKKYIQRLNLMWGRHLSENQISESLLLLDNLCPHQNLRELKVYDYPGVSFSSWLPSLTNIVEIKLHFFFNCEHLPPLERLPYLKILDIHSMEGLKCMHYEEISDVFFPSLERLSFDNCENLRGWERLGDVNNANDIDNHLSLPPFPRLSYLAIRRCPNLTCMPTYPHLVQLILYSCSVKPMIETCMVQLQSSSSYPLSALKHLEIGWKIEIEAMAEEWMQNLTSLHRLSVWGSPISAPLSRHLQHLPAELEVLEIYAVDKVDKLDLWKDEEDVSTQCQAPHCLCSLQHISIFSCENLKALPEQICDLQSLRGINIFECPNLESLPEGMHRLTNLQTLQIIRCPLLSDRCKDEDGEDWPKIAHIPNIIVGSF